MSAKYQAYPENKDSGVEVIGEVPKSWVVGRLKQIVDQNRQITYGIVQAGPNKKGGIPYIRPADMTDEGGVKDYDGLLRTSPEIAADYERSKIKPGDIVCSIGPSFGKLMITPETLEGANLTQGTARVAISSAYNARYFFWALRATSSFQQWESSVGGATFRALNLGPLADTFVVVPSNSEQEKIANFLDHETAKIDTLIEKQQQLIKLLKEKRQAVISHTVTKGLNPNAPMRESGVEWLGEVPEHWVLKSLGWFSEIRRGSGYQNIDMNVDHAEETISMLRISDIHTVEPIKIVKTDEVMRYTVKENDILVAGTGATAGISMIVKRKDHGLVHSYNSIKVRISTAEISSQFVQFFLCSSFISSLLDVSFSGSAQPFVDTNGLSKLKCLIPTYEEQLEIVSYLNDSLEKLDILETHALSFINLLQERRTALISAAVTGKIDVRNWQAPEPSDNQNKEVAA